jgi:FkbM family methyltransferase
MHSKQFSMETRDSMAITRELERPRYDPAWLIASGPFRQHHPVFSRFRAFEGPIPNDVEVDFIGMRTRCEFLRVLSPSSNAGSPVPALNEDYFEWIDLLLSVCDARDRYTAVELGAGYGCWGIRAALAARDQGIGKIRIGLVEAEPAHLSFLRQQLSDNAIGPEEVNIHECAVSDEDGAAEFYVGSPTNFGEETPRTWYGQAISKDYERAADLPLETADTYYGHPVLTYASGWKAIAVEKTDIRRILRQYEEIDLLDLDVQGEELKILSAGADLLDRQVKRIHVGTHSPELEEGLRKLFRGRGWHLLRDYGCNKVNPTPFGEVEFVDGVQSWINLRFDLSVA